MRDTADREVACLPSLSVGAHGKLNLLKVHEKCLIKETDLLQSGRTQQQTNRTHHFNIVYSRIIWGTNIRCRTRPESTHQAFPERTWKGSDGNLRLPRRVLRVRSE